MIPPPMTDPEADLTSFKDMPLEVVRFAKSDLVAFATAEGIVAALMLWGSSWHSRPAGSLTDDDRSLMRAAGYSRGAEAKWQEVREDALRGWIKCSDGKLYHPVVAEKVAASWLSRLKQMHRNYGSAVRMHNQRNPDDKRDALAFEDWLENGRPEGVKSASKPLVQASLPLAEADPRAPTRTGASDVPDDGNNQGGDSYAQHDDELRVTDGVVTRVEPTKGREGKGREGISIESTPLPPAAPAGGDDGKFDRLGIMNDLCTTAGVSVLQPTRISANLAIVEEWLKLGVDIEGVAKPTIERVLKDTTETRIGSLAFFDGAVRRAHTLHQRHKSARSATPSAPPPQPAPTPPPLATGDQDDERIAKLRKRLSREPYAKLVGPDMIALTINGRGLVVTARSPDHAQRIRDRIGSDLHVFAETFLGSPAYIVRSQ